MLLQWWYILAVVPPTMTIGVIFMATKGGVLMSWNRSLERYLIYEMLAFWFVTATFQTETYLVKEGQDTHGYSGPLKVSIYDPSRNVLADQFLDLVKKYDKNTPVFDDVNELSVGNGWSVSLCILTSCTLLIIVTSDGQGDPCCWDTWSLLTLCRWIDPQTGKRQDTAHTFVYGTLKSTELQVLTECQVTRVLIDS